MAVVAAVGWLHSNGLVHGDIKPENFVLGGGRVKLIDFGSALLDGRAPDAAVACRFGIVIGVRFLDGRRHATSKVPLPTSRRNF